MQIDFYILQSSSHRERALFGCRLIEKIWRAGHTIVIRTESASQSEQLDDLLWTFRPGSFIPHHTLQAAGGEALPQPITTAETATAHLRQSVLLSDHDAALSGYPVVINLKTDTLPIPEQFSRIVELIDQDSARLVAGRQRYQHYQRQGHTLITHKI